jgi:hypothetical protein
MYKNIVSIFPLLLLLLLLLLNTMKNCLKFDYGIHGFPRKSQVLTQLKNNIKYAKFPFILMLSLMDNSSYLNYNKLLLIKSTFIS